MRVLIVEDRVTQLEPLRIILESYGYTVYTAGDGRTAQEKAEVHPVDAVILDWVLPCGMALGFLNWLRLDPRTAAVPVIISTGLSSTEETLQEAARIPGVTLMQKPFAVEMLLEILGQHKERIDAKV